MKLQKTEWKKIGNSWFLGKICVLLEFNAAGALK